jgi:hypothetical protein
VKPVLVEVVAYAPTGFFHCTHCEIIFKEQGIGDKIHSEQLQSAMPEELMRDYAQVSVWVNSLVDRYGDKIAIRVIDAASIEGVWAAVRYGLHRFPVAIVDKLEKLALTDWEAGDAAIARRVAVHAAATESRPTRGAVGNDRR